MKLTPESNFAQISNSNISYRQIYIQERRKNELYFQMLFFIFRLV